MDFVGTQGLSNNLRRIGNEGVAVHGNPAVGSDKTRATLAANFFARVSLSIDCGAAGVLVAGTIPLHENLHRTGGIRICGPLDDVVMMLAPIEFANIEAMGPGFAIER